VTVKLLKQLATIASGDIPSAIAWDDYIGGSALSIGKRPDERGETKEVGNS
jgi:hypothetical protein